jgi:hypothetical protein
MVAILLVLLSLGVPALAATPEPSPGPETQALSPILAPTPIPFTPTPSPTPSKAVWRSVEKALGKEGEVLEGAFHLTFPRYDLNLMIEGTVLEPPMVESVLSFQGPPSETSLLSARLMLLDREVPTALERLLEEGLEARGLEAPFWNAAPGVKELQVRAKGRPERVAGALKRALRGTGTLKEAPTPTAPQAVSPLVEEAFGPARRDGSTLRYDLGRGPSDEEGMALGRCTLVFQREGDRSAVQGDWVLTSAEALRVLRALSSAGFKPAFLRQGDRGDSARLRFWYAGPLNEVLPTLLKEWRRLVPTPSATPGP